MVMTTDYWATPPMRRDQCVLFAPTLDEMIALDDPVRLVDEVLAGRDWADWEAEYDLTRGQPPIHPRYVAATRPMVFDYSLRLFQSFPDLIQN